MGCVQSIGIDDEAKARKSHRRLLSLPHCVAFNLVCAVGGEGYLYLFPMFISVLRGTTDHLSCILGNDEIESQLERDGLMAKNEIKILLLGAGESDKVRRWNPYTDRRGLNAFSQ